MLKKIIPTSVGLVAIAIVVAVMISLPAADVAEKNPGLVPPPTSVYEITQLEEINESTPNKVETAELSSPSEDGTGDLSSSETRELAAASSEPNKEYAKYQNIAEEVGIPGMNVKILSNGDNSKTTILISQDEITEETTDYQFKYVDQGIWISILAFKDESLPLDYFTENPDEGYEVVQVNDQYQAAIQSMNQIEQSGEIVDVLLSLNMVTESHQISILGFISDEQAIKIADYLTRA